MVVNRSASQKIQFAQTSEKAVKTGAYQEQPDTKKNNKIVEFYSTGSYTKASLARMFKVTRQRIDQIVKRAKNQP